MTKEELFQSIFSETPADSADRMSGFSRTFQLHNEFVEKFLLPLADEFHPAENEEHCDLYKIKFPQRRSVLTNNYTAHSYETYDSYIKIYACKFYKEYGYYDVEVHMSNPHSVIRKLHLLSAAKGYFRTKVGDLMTSKQKKEYLDFLEQKKYPKIRGYNV